MHIKTIKTRGSVKSLSKLYDRAISFSQEFFLIQATIQINMY
jgi:hypothetical protein